LGLPAATQPVERAIAAPANATEAELARAMAEVLRLGEVGPDEDFFALGGHSLLAMRLLGRIESLFGVRLTIRDFFAAPTVAGLAVLVSGEARHEAEAPVTPRT